VLGWPAMVEPADREVGSGGCAGIGFGSRGVTSAITAFTFVTALGVNAVFALSDFLDGTLAPATARPLEPGTSRGAVVTSSGRPAVFTTGCNVASRALAAASVTPNPRPPSAGAVLPTAVGRRGRLLEMAPRVAFTTIASGQHWEAGLRYAFEPPGRLSIGEDANRRELKQFPVFADSESEFSKLRTGQVATTNPANLAACHVLPPHKKQIINPALLPPCRFLMV